MTKGFWQQQKNRKQFFLDLAAEVGIDPKDPESWTQVTRSQVLAKQVHFIRIIACLSCL